MDKEKTLQSIHYATRFHEMQMEKIKSVIEGDEVQEPTPLSKTECDFGKWLYEDENHLQEILGSLFYEKIELLHARWHSEYKRAFELLSKKRKAKGLFSKIIKGSKLNDMEIDKLKVYYSELSLTTQELLKVLGSSERRISALPESKFN